MKPTLTFRNELQVSIEPLLVVALFPILAGAYLAGPNPQVMVSFFFLITALLLTRWWQAAGKCFLVAVICVMIFWLSAADPDVLIFLFLPVGLTAALLGRHASLITAVLVALVVISMSWVGALAQHPRLDLVFLSILCMVVIIFAIYQPVYQFARWSEEYYEHTSREMKEAREQKVQLHQTVEDLSKASKQLKAANERIASALQLAEEAQAAKSAFVAKVSHEFRTPLNMIIGLVDLLVQSPDLYGVIPGPVIDDLRIIYRNCDHLTSLVNDVLDLSQSESGRLSLYKEQVQIWEIIEEAATVVRPLVDKKGLYLNISVPPEAPQIYIDRTRIRQVILNLLSNAARFVEKGGISVFAKLQQAHLVVSVADTGPGIAPEDADRIFEPFCQGTNRMWRDQSGSGLGLTICKQIVELHGGRIWMETKLGVGTVFYFDLPLVSHWMPTSPPGRWIIPEWDWKEPTRKTNLPDLETNPRILLFDPEGELNHAFLRFTESIDLVGVTDIDTLEEEEHHESQVVILNLDSPALLWEQVNRVRNKLKNTLIIGCNVLAKNRRAKLAGAVDYLVKPLTRKKIVGALEKVKRPLRRVLIADDDENATNLMERMLLAINSELEILKAASGEEALMKMRVNSVDLVFLDILLIDTVGWEVMRQKNQDSDIRDIPVIFASAQDPAEQPARSQMILLTTSEGISPEKVLESSLSVSRVLARAEEPF